MSTAITVIEKHQDGLIKALPSHIDRDRFFAIAVSVAKSQDIAECHPTTVALAVFECAKLGLIPDRHTGHAYVLPYYDRKKGCKTAQLIIGYRGFIELARRSRQLGAVHTEIVYDGEDFEYWVDEQGPHIKHTPDLNGDRDINRAKYVYCVAHLRDSDIPLIRIVTRAEVEKVKPTDAKSFSPWKSDEAAMWLKTAVRRASKLWPMTPELGRAVYLDEQAERGEAQDFQPLSGQQLEVLTATQTLSLDDEAETETVQTGSGDFDVDEISALMESEK